MAKFQKNEEYYGKSQWTTEQVRKEVHEGLSILNKIDKKIITFFGAHKIAKTHPDYKHCKNTAYSLGRKGYAIMSGGGPGIMLAANSGATEAKTLSIGFKAKLLSKEKVMDNIFTDQYSFHFCAKIYNVY